MLKKYIAPMNLRLVGKAWEIRHTLRQEQKLRGGHVPLKELLTISRSKSSS
jgi:hypothetical protein